MALFAATIEERGIPSISDCSSSPHKILLSSSERCSLRSQRSDGFRSHFAGTPIFLGEMAFFAAPGEEFI